MDSDADDAEADAAPNYSRQQKESGSSSTGLWVGLSLGFAAVCAAVFYYRVRQARMRHDQEMRQRAKVDERHVQRVQAQRGTRLIRDTQSMYFSRDAIPVWIYYAVPVVLLINVALFVQGHLNLGAQVDLHLGIAGNTAIIERFFEFSIAKSIFDLLRAGAYFLAIILAVFSGLWPYCRMMTVAYFWFAPPWLLHPLRRGSGLVWLDTLGKWSMIDIYGLVVSPRHLSRPDHEPDNLHKSTPKLLGRRPVHRSRVGNVRQHAGANPIAASVASVHLLPAQHHGNGG